MKVPLWEYPPMPYLEQVLRHCHKAGLSYLELWKNRDKNNKVTINKAEIRSRFLTSVSMFNHNLLCLAQEGLINIEEKPSSLEIELVGWDEDVMD